VCCSFARPGTTENECSIKFHSLRNQFNIENAKVKASIKSDTTLHAANFETPHKTSCSENICTPPTISPNSTASSGISSSLHSVHSLTKTAEKRKVNNDNTYSDAIKIIVDTLKQPIVVKSDFSQDTTANSLYIIYYIMHQIL